MIPIDCYARERVPSVPAGFLLFTTEQVVRMPVNIEWGSFAIGVASVAEIATGSL